MKIFVTRQIPNRGIDMLKNRGYEVLIYPEDRTPPKSELIVLLKKRVLRSKRLNLH